MKRIYVSFFTTITIALAGTFIAFINRNDMKDIVTMDKITQPVSQDSTVISMQNYQETFN